MPLACFNMHFKGFSLLEPVVASDIIDTHIATYSINATIESVYVQENITCTHMCCLPEDVRS